MQSLSRCRPQWALSPGNARAERAEDMHRLRGMLDIISLLLPERVPCALRDAREEVSAAPPSSPWAGVCLWVGASDRTSVSTADSGDDTASKVAGFACLVHAGVLGSFSRLLGSEISSALPSQTVVVLDRDPDAVWAVIQGAYAAKVSVPGSCSPSEFSIRIFEAARRLEATELQYACVAAICDHGPTPCVLSLLSSSPPVGEAGSRAAMTSVVGHGVAAFAYPEWQAIPVEQFQQLIAKIVAAKPGSGPDVVLGALLWAAGQLPKGALPEPAQTAIHRARAALAARSRPAVVLRAGSGEEADAGSRTPWAVQILSVAGAGEALRPPLERAGALGELPFHEFELPALLSSVFPSGLLRGSHRLAAVLRRSGFGKEAPEAAAAAAIPPDLALVASGPAVLLSPSLAVRRRPVLSTVTVDVESSAPERVASAVSAADEDVSTAHIPPVWGDDGPRLPPTVPIGAVPLSMSVVCAEGERGVSRLHGARLVVAAASTDAGARLEAAAAATSPFGASGFLSDVSSLSRAAEAVSMRLARFRSLKAACVALDALAAAETRGRLLVCVGQHPGSPGFVGTLLVVVGCPSAVCGGGGGASASAAGDAEAAGRVLSLETWKWLSGTSGLAIVGPTSSRMAAGKAMRITRGAGAAAAAAAAAPSQAAAAGSGARATNRKAKRPGRGPRAAAVADMDDDGGSTGSADSRGKRRKGGKRAKTRRRSDTPAADAPARRGGAERRTAEADLLTLARPPRGGAPTAAPGGPAGHASGDCWPFFGARSEYSSKPGDPDAPAVMCGRRLALLRSSLQPAGASRCDSLEALRKFLLSVGQFASARSRPDTLESIDLVVEGTVPLPTINSLVLCKAGGRAGQAGGASLAVLHCQCFVSAADPTITAAIARAGPDFACLSRCDLPNGDAIAAVWAWARV